MICAAAVTPQRLLYLVMIVVTLDGLRELVEPNLCVPCNAGGAANVARASSCLVALIATVASK